MAKKSSTKSKKSSPPKGRKTKAGRKTKKQNCIELLSRSKGASLAELQKATGWQPHSVRGFLSGTIRKLEGLTLVTDTNENSARRYRIETGN